ncbi:MAG: CNP1-like family protein [Sulfuricaulis sp.]
MQLVRPAHLLYTTRPMHGAARFSDLRIGGRAFSLVRLFLAVALVAAAYPAHAMRDKNGDEVQNFDYDAKYTDKWKEAQVVIPAYPKDSDLLRVPLSANDRLKVYIDLKSISLASDRVSRFSYVVESPAGARSVFYDGFRCETRQYKTYATGTSLGSFDPVVKPQWRTMLRSEINTFRYQLDRYYVCNDNGGARTPEDFVHQLRYQPR